MFIPARSGSKGLKNKNIIKLKSHPLIGHTILLAKKINHCEKICFSTDSKLYLKKANEYKINETYIRPKKLSKDLIEDKQVLIDYFKKIKKKIVSHLKIDVPTYSKNKLPKNLKLIPITTPGSRFIK